jgi:hypothetical protein
MRLDLTAGLDDRFEGALECDELMAFRVLRISLKTSRRCWNRCGFLYFCLFLFRYGVARRLSVLPRKRADSMFYPASSVVA